MSSKTSEGEVGYSAEIAPLSQRRRTTYCDECQLWLPCHKYDAGYRAEEVLYLCDECVLEVQP